MGNVKRFSWINGLWVVLIGLGLLLTACTDQSTTQPAPTVAAPATALAGQAPAPQVTALAGLPYDCSKVFCFGLAQEPVGILQGWFDPANLVDQPSLQIVRQIYETLMVYKSPGMEAQPSSLLKYPPKISQDGLTYSFRIGKGLLFSDGSPLDVDAVKFNFDRWSNPGNLYHKGDFKAWATYFGGFPGKLAGITIDPVNNYVTLKLNQPMADLLQVLALPQFSLVAPSSFNSKTGLMERSIGSNLYELERPPVHGETKYVVLRKNQQHYVERYEPNDPKAPQPLSPIVALVLREKDDGLDALRSGLVAATDKIHPEEVAEAAKDNSLVLLDRQPLNVAFLGMNVVRPPFNNTAIRQAFAAAIDTKQLVQSQYFGLGQPAGDLLPPTLSNRPQDQPPYNYDPDRARRLLEVYGYNAANPLRIDLWVLPVPRAYYPDPHKVADAIASDLAKVNVVVTVRDTKTWPVFYKDRLNNDLDFYMFGWQGNDGDPNEFLGEFYGKPRGEGGLENETLYKAVQDAEAATDPQARQQLYAQALNILNEQVGILPLAYTKSVVAVRPNVKGYVPSPDGLETWFNLSLK